MRNTTHFIPDCICRRRCVSSRHRWDDGAICDTEIRNTVHGQTAVNNTSLPSREHDSRATGMHQRLNDSVLDKFNQSIVLSDIRTWSHLDGIALLPSVGGVDPTEIVNVGSHDVEIDRVSTCGVVDDWSSIVIGRVQDDGAAAEGLQEERSPRAAGGERHLEYRVLRMLESLSKDLELGEVAVLHCFSGVLFLILAVGNPIHPVTVTSAS